MDRERGVSLSFRDLSYEIKNKHILNKINGHVESGKLLAILGPSGAGKSTLLDILSLREKHGKISGDVYFNGDNNYKNWKEKIAYVEQEDFMLSNLTVRESIQFSLELRVSSSHMTAAEKDKTITDLLKKLNLTKVADSRIGNPSSRGISGGERRRLSIAMELVTSPSIVCLDEPTSGLDSHNALRVMKCLKRLCEESNVTIIATLHQPRSNVFHLFDYLCLLVNGSTAYFGPAVESISYFSSNGLVCPEYLNPADYFLDMMAEDDDDDDANNNNSSTHNIANQITEKTSLLMNTLFSLKSENRNTAYRENKDSNNNTTTADLHTSNDRCNADHLIELFNNSKQKETILQQIDENISNFSSMSQLKMEYVANGSNILKQQKSWSDYICCKASPSYDNSSAFYSTDNGSSPRSKMMADFNFEDQRKTSVWHQLVVLTRRTWRDTIRDTNVLFIRSSAAVIVAVLIGLMFFQQPNDYTSESGRLNSLLFLMCCFSLISLPSISKYIEERNVVMKETNGGYYTTFPYITSHIICELPPLSITVFAYGAISYWMIGYYSAFGNFCFFIAVMLLVIMVGYGMAQLIATMVSSTNTAIALYVMFFLYSMLMGGFIIPKDNFPNGFTWLLWTSYFYPGFVALVINEFQDRSWGLEVLLDMEITGMNEYYCALLILFMWIGIQILEYLALRFYIKGKK